MTCLNLTNVLFYIISVGVSYNDSEHNSLQIVLHILIYIVLFIAITITSSISSYSIESSKRTEHKLMHDIESEFQSNNNILSQLLPSFVRNRVRQGSRYIAEEHGEVSILFCDICDFDRICKEYTPTELTTFLDSFFQTLDQMCENNGITKIETVGKTYMACAGFKDFETDISDNLRRIPHARRAIEMSLAILELVQNIELKYGGNLQVKIGINSGKVTAGVVGHHKPQFSLVGDAVNTSSRMCSTIDLPNQIQITTETYKMCGDLDGLSFLRNEVEAKGKGKLQTFYVYEDKKTFESSHSIIETNRFKNRASINVPSLGSIIPGSINTNSSIIEDGTTRRSQETFREKFATQIIKSSSLKLEENNLFNFSFKESEKEKELRLSKTKDTANVLFYGLSIALIAYSLLLLFYSLLYKYVDTFGEDAIIAGRVINVGLLVFCICVHKRLYLYRFYPLLIVVVLF